jgi:hypothetical protein
MQSVDKKPTMAERAVAKRLPSLAAIVLGMGRPDLERWLPGYQVVRVEALPELEWSLLGAVATKIFLTFRR